MKYYEFDSREKLKEIKAHYLQVKEIKDSLAEKRDEYRKFAKNIELSFSSLQKCCDEFEKSLLIKCYTFSEQLVKNCIYILVDKDNHPKEHINNFINHKINPESFSPNVKLEKIEKIVNEFFKINFKFIRLLESNEIKIYDEMINTRHIYAHKGDYVGEIDFETVIKVLYFIEFELNIFLKGKLYREDYQEKIKEIKESCIVILRKENNFKNPTYKNEKEKKELKKDLKSIKNLAKNFEKKFIIKEIEDLKLLTDFFCLIEKISKMDLKVNNYDLIKKLKDKIY